MVEGGLHIKHGAPSPGQQRCAWSPLLGLLLVGQPNPSFERTCQSWLRQLRPAAQVQR